MEIIRASTAGFCMGVSLALQKLEEELSMPRNTSKSRICTLGPIIHNPQVLADFESRGVVCINDRQDVRPEDRVLIRAHGIPRETEEQLRRIGAAVSDATCPRVKKAQLSIAAATGNGATLLLFGESEHPEVRGLVSYARGDAYIFSAEKELGSIELFSDSFYVLASQTTQDRETFDTIREKLSEILPNLVVLQTICDATRKRQEEARRIARMVEAMVVVGGKQSGNTRRLAHLAAQSGIATFHIESCTELRKENFLKKNRIGLTAGASTPKSIIDETENWLRNLAGTL